MNILFFKKITFNFLFFSQLVYRNMKLKCADFSRIVMEKDKHQDIPEKQPILIVSCPTVYFFNNTF